MKTRAIYIVCLHRMFVAISNDVIEDDDISPPEFFSCGATTNKCLLTVVNSIVLSLVCRNVVAVPRQYNLRRHFETQHPNLAELDSNEKRLKA